MSKTKTKKPDRDIYKSLKQNNLIVWGLLVSFVIVSVYNKYSSTKQHKELMNKVLFIGQSGAVLPTNWLDRNDVIHIELKDHLERFHKLFYEYDAYNYKENIEKKALWLADKSVEQLYTQRSNNGHFGQVRQFQMTQTLDLQPENIQVVGDREPYAFRVDATLIITNGNQKKAYQFTTQGNIITCSQNYPLNPHGFLITNFLEVSQKEIKID